MSFLPIIKCLEKVSHRKREECGHLKEKSRLERQKDGQEHLGRCQRGPHKDRGKHKVCTKSKSSPSQNEGVRWAGRQGVRGLCLQDQLHIKDWSASILY